MDINEILLRLAAGTTDKSARAMPDVLIKLARGRSEEQKSKLAEAVAQAVMAGVSCPEGAVSVAIEDVEADRSAEDVYQPDILGHGKTSSKNPATSRDSRPGKRHADTHTW